MIRSSVWVFHFFLIPRSPYDGCPPSSLVLVAGDQVVDVADCRGGFKRYRQGPEITEDFRGCRTVVGGEQHGDIGPDWSPGAPRRIPRAVPGMQLDPGGRLWSDGLTACSDCSRHQ